MAKASSYTVVQQGAVTLRNPDTGDIDYRYPTFSAPGLSTSTASADRPYLLFTVDPVASDNHIVELTLNEQVVFSETFFSGSPNSAHEILDHGVLKATGNELIVASRGDGSFIVAEMTAVYKVNV